MKRIWIGSTGGIAAAAAIMLVVMWLAPAKSPVGPSTAEALASLMRNMETVDALQCETDWRRENETSPTDGWRGTIVRDRGFRAESRDGRLEIYNHQQQKRYTIAAGGMEVRRLHISDSGILVELLRRARLEENFEYFTIRSRAQNAVHESRINREGLSVTRLETLDANGRTMAVEFETATQRLLLCESWINQQDAQPWILSSTRFRYPNPAELPPNLFDPPPLEGKRLVEERETDIQCMVNIRNLGMSIQIFASENEGRLPTRMADLSRYAPDAQNGAWLNCIDANGGNVAIELRTPSELGTTLLAEVSDPSHTVLFRCRMDGFDYLGFADSHVEKRPVSE